MSKHTLCRSPSTSVVDIACRKEVDDCLPTCHRCAGLSRRSLSTSLDVVSLDTPSVEGRRCADLSRHHSSTSSGEECRCISEAIALRFPLLICATVVLLLPLACITRMLARLCPPRWGAMGCDGEKEGARWRDVKRYGLYLRPFSQSSVALWRSFLRPLSGASLHDLCLTSFTRSSQTCLWKHTRPPDLHGVWCNFASQPRFETSLAPAL